MGNRSKAINSGNARFIELGAEGQPFRSLINVDHLTNLRYEHKIEQREIPIPGAQAVEATYDDAGEMLTPPIPAETTMEPILTGFNIILMFGEQGQTIYFNNEGESVATYNRILDMIAGTGNPTARMPKLKVMPPQTIPGDLVGPDGSPIVGPDGKPLDLSPANSEDLVPPPLTDEEMDQLENPEIDIDAIADAVEEGLGEDPPEQDLKPEVDDDDGRG